MLLFGPRPRLSYYRCLSCLFSACCQALFRYSDLSKGTAIIERTAGEFAQGAPYIAKPCGKVTEQTTRNSMSPRTTR